MKEKMKNSNPESKSDWSRVDSMTDRDIDYSDIPEISDDLFAKATFVPAKQLISIRLDTDVVTWLKKSGRGYQTRANKLLRSLMEQQEKSHKRTRARVA